MPRPPRVLRPDRRPAQRRRRVRHRHAQPGGRGRQAGQRPLRPGHADPVPGDLAVGQSELRRATHRITQASVVRFIEDNWLQGERLGGGSFDATAGVIMDMFDFGRRPASRRRFYLDPARTEPSNALTFRRSGAALTSLSRTRQRSRNACRSGCRCLRLRSRRRDACRRDVQRSLRAVASPAARCSRDPAGELGRRCRRASIRIRSAEASGGRAAVARWRSLASRCSSIRRCPSSGKQSCASCHSPGHAYGPPDTATVQRAARDMHTAGVRAAAVARLICIGSRISASAPTSRRRRQRVDLMQLAAAARSDRPREEDRGQRAGAPAKMVPQGGLFWDGRADTLQDQAMVPLLNPVEMDGGSVEIVAAKLRAAHPMRSLRAIVRAGDVRRSAAAGVGGDVRRRALSRSRIRASIPSAASTTHWLEGKARLTPAEMRGLALFNDPAKGNCAGCHLGQPTRRRIAAAVHRPPVRGAGRAAQSGAGGRTRRALFRSRHLRAVPHGPRAADAILRHVPDADAAQRGSARGLLPQRRLPQPRTGAAVLRSAQRAAGKDLPARRRRQGAGLRRFARAFWANIDTTDFPFGLRAGDAAPLDERDIRDIIAFLHTLDDGYQPEH